jgi:hypothetical protein
VSRRLLARFRPFLAASLHTMTVESKPLRILFFSDNDACRAPMTVALVRSMTGGDAQVASAGIDARRSGASAGPGFPLRTRWPR